MKAHGQPGDLDPQGWDLCRTILEAIPEGALIVHGAAREIRDCNSVAARLFGFDREELLGRPLTVLTGGGLEAVEYRPVSPGSPSAFPAKRWLAGHWRHKDGRSVAIERHHRPSMGESGDGKDLVVLVREQTDSFAALHALAETAAVCVTVVQDGVIRHVNSLMCDLLGYSTEEIVGRAPWEFFHPSMREQLKERWLRRAAGHQEPMRYDLAVLTKDGETRWLTQALTVIEYEGRPAFLGAALDITERRKAESALQESENRFRMLCEYLPVGIFHTGAGGAVTYTNKRLQEMSGLTADEAAGHGWFRLVHPDDSAGMRAAIAEATAAGREFAREFRILRPDGEVRWLFARSAPFRFGDGASLLRVGTVEDITLPRQARAALEASEAHFRSIAESIPIPFGVSRLADGRALYGNPLLRQAFGIADEKSLDLNPEDYYVNPAERDMVFARLLEHGRVDGLEVHFRRNDGSRFWALLAGNQAVLNGEPVMLGSFVDITERKRIEEVLRLQRDIGIALGATSSVSDAMDCVLDAALRLEGLDCAGAYLIDRSTGELYLVSYRNLPASFVTRVGRYSRDDPETAAMTAGIPIYRCRGDCRLASEPLQELQLTALAAIPIIQGGRLVGVLNLGSHSLAEIPPSLRLSLEDLAGRLGGTIVRLLAGEDLRASEELFRSISASAFDAMILMDDLGCVSVWNAAAERIFGYSRAEAIGRNLHEFLASPPDLEAHRRGFSLFQANGTGPALGRVSELIALKRDGTKIPVELSISPLRVRGRWHAIGIVRDITERKRAEQAHRASEERYRTLVENVGLGITLIDADYNIVMINQTQAGMFHHEPHELVGQKCFAQFEKRRETCPHCPGRQAMATGRPHESESIGIRDDGSRFPVRILATPLSDEAGRPMGFIEVVEDLTERKKTEEDLRSAQETAQRYLDIVRTAIVALTADGTITLVNQALCQLLGYDEQELLGLNWFDHFLSDKVRDLVRASYADMMAGNTAWMEHYENPVLTRDGQERLVAWRNTVIRNSLGEIIGSLCAGEDVTERRATQDALYRSEETLRSTLASMDDLVFALDTEGRFVALPQHGRPELLVPVEKYTGRHYREVLPPSLSDLLALAIESVGKSGAIGQIDYDLEYKGLTSYWSAKISPRHDHDDRYVGVTIVTRDITERKHAEEELRKFKLVSDASPHGNAIVDTAGNILYINQAFAAMHGYQPHELLGQQLSCFHTAEQLPGVNRLNAQLLSTGVFSNEEVWHVRRDGSVFPTLMDGVAIRDDQGRVRFLTGMAMDLTVQKQLQAEKEALQMQLIQAQKIEALGTLAGGIAHDFNNLLAAIFSYSELARATLPDKHPATETLALMEMTARQARGVTNALLAFTRRGFTEKTTVDWRQVLNDTLNWLQRMLPSCIRVVQEVPDDPLWVSADSTQLQQVIVNLAVNARDAMPRGGELRLLLSRESRSLEDVAGAARSGPGSVGVLSVEDTGMGMSAEVLARAFEPFFTTKSAGEGSGLGLSIVHGIVTAHHGTMGIESTPGQGTCVRIVLPLAPAPPAQSQPSTVEAAPLGKGEPVLLLHADDHVRSILVSLLRASNYKPIVIDTISDLGPTLQEYRGINHSIVIEAERVNKAELWNLKPLLCTPAVISRLVLLLGDQAANEDIADLHASGGEAPKILRMPLLVTDLLREITAICERSRGEET